MKPKIYLFDNHTQTLEHGLNKSLKIEETIKSAINRKLSAICLTDHYPLPPGYEDPTAEKDCAMSMPIYLRYQKKIEKAIQKYGEKIEILRGAEVDWLPEYRTWSKEQIKAWNFDCVIGSVHFVGEIDGGKGRRNFVIDYQEEEFLRGVKYFGGIQKLVKAYYLQVQTLIKSKLFDVVGHLDLIKKYNDGSLFSEDGFWYQEAVLQTLDVMANSGMVLELNTAGWDKKCQAPYPSFWILREAKKRNIPLTIGSDGHTPDTIGRNLNKALDLIKATDYKSLVRFNKRQIKEIKI